MTRDSRQPQIDRPVWHRRGRDWIARALRNRCVLLVGFGLGACRLGYDPIALDGEFGSEVIGASAGTNSGLGPAAAFGGASGESNGNGAAGGFATPGGSAGGGAMPSGGTGGTSSQVGSGGTDSGSAGTSGSSGDAGSGAGGSSGTSGTSGSSGTAGYGGTGGFSGTSGTSGSSGAAGSGGTGGSAEPLGAACSSNAECGSGFCVDDVCCDAACNQGCHRCDVAGSTGSCTPVPSGQDPDNECSPQAQATCGRAGGCNGQGACRLYALGTECIAASCSSDVETTEGQCDGQGTCQPGTSQECTPYVCGSSSCLSSCAESADCQPGWICSGTTCVAENQIFDLVVHDTDPNRAALWSIEENFQIGSSGAHPWPDWANTYVSSIDSGASFLIGRDWIKVSAESKKYAGGPQATITLLETSDVYLVIDDRWNPPQSWTAGWSDTGWNMVFYESAQRPSLSFSIYVRYGQTGSFDLLPIGATTGYNPFVIAD